MTRKSKILLIDDDKSFCKKLKNAYKNKFQIVDVQKPENVHNVLTSGVYDLVLLDLFLDNERVLNGFKLIDTIRKYNSHLPIIAITIDDRRTTTYEALSEYKINDIIVKQEGSFEEWSIKIEKTIKENPIRSAFISYSQKDKLFVDLLKEKLENENIGIARDLEGISAGGGLTEEIVKMIEACSYCIVVLSTNSIDSEWVLRELNFAIKEKGKSAIIPLQLGRVTLPKHFELQIGDQKILRFEGKEKFDTLKSNLDFDQWLSNFPNPFKKLANSYDKRFQEIIKKIYAK